VFPRQKATTDEPGWTLIVDKSIDENRPNPFYLRSPVVKEKLQNAFLASLSW
jgi:hypothetical protein